MTHPFIYWLTVIPHPSPSPLYRLPTRHATYMMFYTINYPVNFKPCETECCFRGPIKPTETLCLVCGLTPAEKKEWRSMKPEQRLELMGEVSNRVNYAWMMWEIMEEPTIQ